MLMKYLIFISCLPFLSGGSLSLHQIYDHPQTKSPQSDFALPQPIPQLVLEYSGNVTAVLGRAALLNCRVRGIGNKTVSWMRHRDTHLLTAGRYTYTNDQRFRAIHKVRSEDYLLQILPTKRSDAGQYECQISTTPVTSHQVYLSIAEPYTEILGGEDIFLEEGFTMNLTCVVRDSPQPPQFIFWYHNQQPISYSSPRGGISQITVKGDTTTSFLLVQEASLTDSGSYACHASVGTVSQVMVHVIRSQKPEQLIPSDPEHINSAASVNSVIISFATLLFHKVL